MFSRDPLLGRRLSEPALFQRLEGVARDQAQELNQAPTDEKHMRTNNSEPKWPGEQHLQGGMQKSERPHSYPTA